MQPKLVDTLLSAEKHSSACTTPVNPYRKLLVCDLLPLLGNENVSFELSPKLLYKLLHKAIEYYLHAFNIKNNVSVLQKVVILINFLIVPHNSQSALDKPEQPWIKLFGILEFVGRHLGWEPYLTNININWYFLSEFFN